MTHTIWILESIDDNKFPYLLTIRQDGRSLLRLRVQERWPGQKGHVFCVREEDDAGRWTTEEVERVPVVSLRRYGKRLAIVLDRPKNKRCDFLFLTKQYKTREGEYEQIFWRTERGLKERKPRVKLSTYTKSELTVAIDSAERYPWLFSDSTVKKEQLPVGDYALKEGNRIVAVVERKTLDNLLAEFGRMSIFHQQLSELEAYRHSALVIEANYSDFLNPDKMKFYPPAFTAKAIAELHAFHPNLSIVFAGNRKLAQEWTLQFFTSTMAHQEDIPHHKVSEVMTRYGKTPETTGGSYYEIRESIENEFPQEFTIAMLRETFPDIPESTLQRVLRDLKKEGVLEPHGRGKKSYWSKTSGEIKEF